MERSQYPQEEASQNRNWLVTPAVDGAHGKGHEKDGVMKLT